MNRAVRVNLSEIKDFYEKEKKLLEYWPHLDKGIEDISKLSKHIKMLVDESERISNDIKIAITKLQQKIEVINQKMIQLEIELNMVGSEIAGYSLQLVSIPPVINVSETNIPKLVPNPEYKDVIEKIAELQGRQREIRLEMAALKSQKDELERLKKELTKAGEENREKRGELQKDDIRIVRHIDRLRNIQKKGKQNSIVVETKLNRMIKIVENYLVLSIDSNNKLVNGNDDDYTIINTNNIKNSFAKRDLNDDIKRYEKNHEDKVVVDTVVEENGYQYNIDKNGACISASGVLKLDRKKERNKGDMRRAKSLAKLDYLKSDQIGHIMGHQFGGADSMINLVPQNCKINQGAFKKLEDDLAKYVESGKKVYVNIVPIYSRGSRRPNGIFYFYEVDGVARVILFPNMKGEEDA